MTKRTSSGRRSAVNRDVLNDRQAARGAGAAGVGGGTLVAIIASALPDGLLKTILIWLAPIVTLALTAAWIWARAKIVEYLQGRDLERYLAATRKAIEDALNNPTLSAEQREEFENNRVELDRLIVEMHLSKTKHHLPKT
jgi:hypothetical protein